LAGNNPADVPMVRQLLQPGLPHLHLISLEYDCPPASGFPPHGIDVALLEADLAWADSLEVMDAIQTRFPGCPVVMMAAPGHEAVVQAAIGRGLAGYAPRLSGQLVGLPEAVQLALARTAERHAVEETCRQYRRLFDSVPVGLYRTTPEGQILEANLTFVRMLGYPDRAALFAVNIIELYVNPWERQRWQSSLAQKTELHFFETQFYRRDGAPIWVENSVGLVTDPPDNPPYYEGILKDITKRKQAELALRESEERFRTIVEQSPISIQILTPDGWTIRVNKAWEELWGVTAADMRSYNILHDQQIISLGMMPYLERGFAGKRCCCRR
jgi:PAS domain S-box-containing protein